MYFRCLSALIVIFTTGNLLAQCDLTIVANGSPATCLNGNDALATVAVSGGTPGYSFEWSTGDTLQTITDLPIGTYGVTVTDAAGCVDSTTLAVNFGTGPFLQNVLSFTLPDCDSTVSFCVNVPLSDYLQGDLTNNGDPYAGTATGCNFDTSFQYAYGILPTDGDFNLDWNVGDTTYTGTFSDLDQVLDSLNLWDPDGFWLLDSTQQIITGGLPGSAYGTIDVSQMPGDTTVMLAVNENLLPLGTQLTLGSGVQELIFTSAGGCTDTLTAIVNCGDGTGIFFQFPYNLTVGDVDTLCLADFGISLDSITVLPGGCAAAPNSIVEYQVDNDTQCVGFSALSEGSEAVCFLVCSPLACDTLQLNLAVLPDEMLRPLAFNDTLLVDKNTEVTFSVLFNDILFDTFSSLLLLDNPPNGTATLSADFLLTYTPDPNFCGVDSMRYELCNVNGCDTGLVVITIVGNDLVIPNGFSPNNDGINDTWNISGLNVFPEHELSVFNRWGNEVLRSSNYQNDWRGQNNGLDLPDGTYFYLIDLGEERRSGWVVIQR